MYARGAMQRTSVGKTLDTRAHAYRRTPSRALACVAAAFASSQAVRFVALLGLCAAYVQGGLTKLADFPGALAEVEHFGVPAAPIVAAATIVTELAGSALVLSGFHRWLGALWLAAFTLCATFVANRFWELPVTERFMAENTFFEHLGLVGGFLLVAWLDVKERVSNKGATEKIERRN
jgi:uncharacterized membrane protein YphA (DoxX/SURF4 family)